MRGVIFVITMMLLAFVSMVGVAVAGSLGVVVIGALFDVTISEGIAFAISCLFLIVGLLAVELDYE
jgi:hypothetical protein